MGARGRESRRGVALIRRAHRALLPPHTLESEVFPRVSASVDLEPRKAPPALLLPSTRLRSPSVPMPLGFIFGQICGILCDGLLQSCAETRELHPHSPSPLFISLIYRSTGRAFAPWCSCCCNCTAPCCSEEDGWEADEEEQEQEAAGSEATERRKSAASTTRPPREADPMLPKVPGSGTRSVGKQR
jgi:hypothetical protein